RRAVARDDLEVAAPVELLVEHRERVEQLHVDRVRLPVAVIAEKTIDGLERVGNDGTGLAIRDLELLARMDVIERKMARGLRCRSQRRSGAHRGQACDAAEGAEDELTALHAAVPSHRCSMMRSREPRNLGLVLIMARDVIMGSSRTRSMRSA